MKENNLDHLFNKGLQGYTKEPKSGSFEKIREQFLQEKLAAKVPTWSPMAYTAIAIILAVGAISILSNPVELKINSKIALNTELPKTRNVELNKKDVNFNSAVKDENSSRIAEPTVNKENKSISILPVSSPKEKSVKEKNTKAEDNNLVNSNEINNSNTIKIKNTGKMFGLNFLRFSKKSDRIYILDGLRDSLKIVSEPKNGKVFFDESTGKFNYLANKGFAGIDSFNYIIYSNSGIEISRGTIKVEVEKDTSSLNNSDGEDLQNDSLALAKDSLLLSAENTSIVSIEKKKLNQKG